jgi:hypothetical protein
VKSTDFKVSHHAHGLPLLSLRFKYVLYLYEMKGNSLTLTHSWS